MTTTSTVQRLKDFLLSTGTKCGHGTTESRLIEFERMCRVKIPHDLRSYFRELNGTAGDYAFGIVRFWSIDECKSVESELASKRQHRALIHSAYQQPVQHGEDYFIIADCMHEVQLYAIDLSSAGALNQVIVLDGGPPRDVATSFSDYVERYLARPESLGLVTD